MPVDEPVEQHPGEQHPVKQHAVEQHLEELIPLLMEVQRNLDGEIRLVSLARQYGYSPFHFHRFFSKTLRETPKRHVDRLRLERAALKLAVTGETVLKIALSVGFKTHETLSRSFKRAFGCSPKDYRQACRRAQAERLERNHGFRGEGCLLSDVHFASLPAMTLLAIRRHGAYADCPIPFQKGDDLWTALVARAQHGKASFHRLPIAISYDDPTVTPPTHQRLDACIPLGAEIAAKGRTRCFRFAGGRFGAIEHTGPLTTISQAYRNLADGIRRSHRYDFDDGPPIHIYRQIHIDGDPAANVTEVYFPVRQAR
jgi:AraC family transcriptional regulator